jgi:TAT (twin-arginine translocation) pathway signal sequence
MPIDETRDVPAEFAVPPGMLAARTTRRTMLKGAAATGLTAATAGVVADILFASPANAADSSTGEGDLVAHVRDARSGDIDLYVGTRHVSVRDRSLATHLARAAR